MEINLIILMCNKLEYFRKLKIIILKLIKNIHIIKNMYIQFVLFHKIQLK
jgi:hypothetical protein